MTTEELLSRMEREHVQRPCCESPACPWPSVCNRCLVDWPCDTARLVAHARSLEAAQIKVTHSVVPPLDLDDNEALGELLAEPATRRWRTMGRICQHCKGQVALANPSGFCSHIHYPEACEVCSRAALGEAQ